WYCVLYCASVSGRNCPAGDPRLNGYPVSADDHDWHFSDLADERLHRPSIHQSFNFPASHVPDGHTVRGDDVLRRLHTPGEPALVDAQGEEGAGHRRTTADDQHAAGDRR